MLYSAVSGGLWREYSRTRTSSYGPYTVVYSRTVGSYSYTALCHRVLLVRARTITRNHRRWLAPAAGCTQYTALYGSIVQPYDLPSAPVGAVRPPPPPASACIGGPPGRGRCTAGSSRAAQPALRPTSNASTGPTLPRSMTTAGTTQLYANPMLGKDDGDKDSTGGRSQVEEPRSHQSSPGARSLLLRKIEGVHSSAIFGVTFSPDGKTVCLGSWDNKSAPKTLPDKTASLIDVETGAVLRKIEGVHSLGIHGVAFSPNGKTVCLGSADKTASLIDVETGAVLRKIEGVHLRGIRGVAFSPDGKTVCLGSSDKTASLIDVETGAVLRKIEGVHSEGINGVAFSLDGKMLCLGSADKTASLIDVETGAVLRKIEGVHSGSISGVAFSPNGKMLCLGSSDKTASLIDVETGAVLRKIEGVHSGSISGVAFSLDGKMLCLGSYDKTASLIDVETGVLLRKIEGVHSSYPIYAVAISPNGKTVCLGSGDRTASLIDLKCSVAHKIRGVHTELVYGVAFSPDSKMVCLGSADKTASLIDVETGAVLRKIEGVHSGGINGVAFSPDGGQRHQRGASQACACGQHIRPVQRFMWSARWIHVCRRPRCRRQRYS
eukprot:COSAG01_NODE_771_length_13718_cov_54.441442_14_plen_606_part_00